MTNLSVNPARTAGPPVFVAGWALLLHWMFWVASILGALGAGFAFSWLAHEVGEPVVGDEAPATA